jgi:hypothetical protein
MAVQKMEIMDAPNALAGFGLELGMQSEEDLSPQVVDDDEPEEVEGESDEEEPNASSEDDESEESEDVSEDEEDGDEEDEDEEVSIDEADANVDINSLKKKLSSTEKQRREFQSERDSLKAQNEQLTNQIQQAFQLIQQTKQEQEAEGREAEEAFKNLDDDDYVSVSDVKSMVDKYIKAKNQDAVLEKELRNYRLSQNKWLNEQKDLTDINKFVKEKSIKLQEFPTDQVGQYYAIRMLQTQEKVKTLEQKLKEATKKAKSSRGLIPPVGTSSPQRGKNKNMQALSDIERQLLNFGQKRGIDLKIG